MSRHLGIDLGGTFIKWAVVSRAVGDAGSSAADSADDPWEVLDRGEVPTHADEGPAVVIERLAEIGRQAIEADHAIASIGIAIPGRYDPSSGATGLLPNFPHDWTGVPVAQYVGLHTGVPTI